MQVLVSKPGEKIKVYVVTDLEESAILHWALAKSPGEWSVRVFLVSLFVLMIVKGVWDEWHFVVI